MSHLHQILTPKFQNYFLPIQWCCSRWWLAVTQLIGLNVSHTRPDQASRGLDLIFSWHYYHHKPCQSPSSPWWCEDGHIDASLDDYWQGGCGAQCPLQFPLFSLSLNFFKFFNFLIPSTSSSLFAYHLIIILLMPLLSLPTVCKRLKCQMRCNY